MIPSVRSADATAIATAGSPASAASPTTQAAGSFPLDVLERGRRRPWSLRPSPALSPRPGGHHRGQRPHDLGKTEFAEDTKDERFIIRERRAGAFQRSIRLPESVNADAAITNYEHGVLSVTLPKAEEKKARRLEIGTPAA